jgi:hypothetical protein
LVLDAAPRRKLSSEAVAIRFVREGGQRGDVVSMRVDGTDPHDEASLSGGEDATSLAVDGSYVYWTDTRSPGAVMRALL